MPKNHGQNGRRKGFDMTDKEFRNMRINVILFAIGAMILALDLFIWRP
jgi:hypothetical protein